MIRDIANRYTIIAEIGQGGMADVYKAFDTILNRIVAVKVLRSKLSEDPMTLVRFQREAYAASKLSHPNIIDIYDVGEYDGLHYIVMEFIRGRTLKQLIAQRGSLDVREAVAIMKQLTSAVAAAHRSNIIHRDIKPQNVLIKDDGTVKITDFGIAVANDSVQLTWNNAVMGSSHYLAPETAQGHEPDPQIDIYSLGIVFYELLTGDVPFKGKTPTEIALAHLRKPLPKVRAFNPSIPQAVENIVIRASAKDPAERYQTADEMAADLAVCLDSAYANVKPVHLKKEVLELETGKTRKTSTGSHRKKHSSFKGIMMGTAAGIVLILLALCIGGVTGLLRIPGFLGYETMPSLAGMNREQAETALAAANFSLDRVYFDEKVDDAAEKGTVTSQSIKAGQVVSQDSPIHITLSKGPSFLIPDYVGRSLDSVQAELAEQGISLDIQTESRGEPNTNPGIILAQTGLYPGDRIDPDSHHTLHLVVSSYPSLVIPAELIGMDVDEAKAFLNEKGIAVNTKQTGTGTTVIRTDPEVGTTYTQEGTDSVVTLYY